MEHADARPWDRHALSHRSFFNDNEILFARYLHGSDNTLGGDPNNSRPQLYPDTPPLGEVYRGSDNGAIGLHSVLSAHVFNELTAGVSRFSAIFTQGQANPSWPNVPAYCRARGSAFNNIDPPCRNVPETAREITTPQILDNLTIVHGSHIIKTGLNFRFYQHNDQRGEPSSTAVTPLISFSASLRAAQRIQSARGRHDLGGGHQRDRQPASFRAPSTTSWVFRRV